MDNAFRTETAPVRIEAYMRTWGAPERQTALADYTYRLNRYAILQGYADGNAYKGLDTWATYLQEWDLPARTRQIRSHVRKGIAFYRHYVYPGQLANDGRNLPNGIENAIPLADDTNDDLAAAIGQLWQWWNWQQNMTLLVARCATLGEFLVEVVDNWERGKVHAALVWPGYLTDLQLDYAGNVVSYTKEYEALKDDGSPYWYKRTINKQRIQVWEAHELVYDEANPYGFVPACWFRHSLTGGIHGDPFIAGSQTALDEMNMLFTVANDKLRAMAESPLFVSGKLQEGTIKRQMQRLEDEQWHDVPEEARPLRNKLRAIQMTADFKLDTIRLDMSQVRASIDTIQEGIYDECPEVRFEEELREMSTLTGPGAERALGGVLRRLQVVAAGHDLQSTKLKQMAIAIAGYRISTGDWASANEAAGKGRALTEQQQKFAQYDLTSYDKGELDFDIMPRTIVQPTYEEQLQIGLLKQQLGVPNPVVWRDEVGVSVDEIRAWAVLGWIDQATFDQVLRLQDLLQNPGAIPQPQPGDTVPSTTTTPAPQPGEVA